MTGEGECGGDMVGEGSVGNMTGEWECGGGEGSVGRHDW